MFLVETELKTCDFAILIVVHLKKLAFDEIVRIVGCDLVCRNTPIRKTKYNKFAIAAEKPFVMELTRANRVLNVQNTY